MKFSYYDLGHLSKGQVVEVCLSAAANVRLLDSSNYSNYKNGRRHRYYGGYVKKRQSVGQVERKFACESRRKKLIRREVRRER